MFSKSPTYIAITFFLVAIVILVLDINTPLFLTLNHVGSLFPDQVWTIITTFGDRLFVLICLFLFFWKHPELLRAALLAALISLIISIAMKPLIGLARPPAILDPTSFHLIGEKLITNSFPSGHTLGAFAVMGSIVFYCRKFWGVLFFIASAVGLSRIMIGVHWPIDVLVGAALGWVCGWLGNHLIKADLWRDNNIWNYLTYIIYLIISVSLFWQGTNYEDAFWMVKVVAGLGIIVALGSFIWLKKGGNKKPISVVGWLS